MMPATGVHSTGIQRAFIEHHHMPAVVLGTWFTKMNKAVIVLMYGTYSLVPCLSGKAIGGEEVLYIIHFYCKAKREAKFSEFFTAE